MSQPLAQTTKASMLSKGDPVGIVEVAGTVLSNGPSQNLWTSIPVSNDMLFKQSCDKQDQILDVKNKYFAQSSLTKNYNSQK